jgi:uncharacterized protein (DUF362 family)
LPLSNWSFEMQQNSYGNSWTRRQWLFAAGAGLAVRPGVAAPASRVAVARCVAYDATVLSSLRTMFDGIGGIGKLVAGKTVAIKINMTGQVRARSGFLPAWQTHWTHPAVISAAVRLIGIAGAKKIRILEGSYEDDNPLEENILQGGGDPKIILGAASNVEMENTDCLGSAREYRTLQVPGGGLIYPAFDCNHSYSECDVMVSIAKLKEHQCAGVALSMNNMIGITPATIYGDAAGFENPAERPYGGRGMFHTGRRQPSPPSAPEKDTGSPREAGYRVPRVTVDILKARPVDLAIIDGIETQTAFEGAIPPAGYSRRIRPVKPGILVAGFNPVCTDAVAAALMGFDPSADRGKAPFENCDSTLKIAEEAGIGTRDLAKIEIAGPALKTLQFAFRG